MRPTLWLASIGTLIASVNLTLTHVDANGSPQANFSSESELVLVHVTVKDHKNQYVTDLPAEAFSVFDDGRPQSIRFFISEDAPVTIGLLVDSSGSMGPNRALTVAAAGAFAETSNSQDEIFALAFNEDVERALPPDDPFTSDPATFTRLLARAIVPRGRTALYDAILRGLDYVNKGSHERKVLVIVSDGADNASRARFDDVLARIQASNVVVYGVTLVDPNEWGPPSKRLKELAAATGGDAFVPDTAREVSDALTRVARDIRHAYVIAYTPSEQMRDGRLRHIRVTVRSPDRRVVVRTRAAYLAGGG